ncbi:aminodeoxyfutalosine synthase [Planctomycetales bacterium]|nr:aminodeoxyfutalosine synthase [Planctomycetales bacterium]GHT35751.1 aminodeoxyfutalosine synthase [Planctomycetales bacterium]
MNRQAEIQQRIEDKIKDKIESGKVLSFEDGVALFRDFGFHSVGILADAARRKRHGNKAYYVVNAHINPSNVCITGCPLCAFAVKADAQAADKRAYTLEIDSILEQVQHAVDFGAKQIHIVSSIHPDKNYEWYRNILFQIHQCFPAVRLKAWTAVEIAHFAELSNRTVKEVLADMQNCGLKSMPGGGAEIFDNDVRQKIAPKKISADKYLEVHRTAHQLGIPTNASMLFGHLETPEHRIEHLLRLRELQEETGGFDCLVPLVFHPKNTQIKVNPVSPQEILHTIAVSRLMLDNFSHIKAYWVTLGESLAQIALSYGADDFDGTVFEERIHHDAGSATPPGLTVKRLTELIQGASFVPVEY